MKNIKIRTICGIITLALLSGCTSVKTEQKPMDTETWTNEPMSGELPSSDAMSSEPTSSELPPSESASSELPPSESAPSELPPSESTPSESTPSESTPSESAPSELPPSESTPSELAPSESAPSESAPSELPPSESAPSELAPSESASDKPVASATEAPGEKEPTEEDKNDEYAVEICWEESWQYADYSKVHGDAVTLYRATGENRKNFVVAVNAGHGSEEARAVKTLCHPDGSPKVTGGSTSKGAIYAAGVSRGTTFLDGVMEGEVTLQLALVLKERLLQEGFDVLMIREAENVRLDNIARTVYANNNADCHIALHYNSSKSDKGFFYISVPKDETYRKMEPVASHYMEHEQLGESLLAGMRKVGRKIFAEGKMEIDLTQTSYSTIPSIDVEVGDRKSDHSQAELEKVAGGLIEGMLLYYAERT